MTIPRIEKSKHLPERIIFHLTTGERLIVDHYGNRLEISTSNGLPLIIHPKSSNTAAVLPHNGRELNLPFNPDELEE